MRKALYLMALLYLPFAFEWVKRKLVARVQERYGPLHNSPSGFFQPLYDFLKLLSKKQIIPEKCEKAKFLLIPYVRAAIFVFLLAFIVPGLIVFPYSTIFVLVLLLFDSVLIWLLSFSSKSRYSVIGGCRNLLQTISFDMIFFLCVATPLVMTGNFSLAHKANIVFLPAFLISFFAALGVLEVIPFDIPTAEQEIVAGWETELSGPGLAFVKYAHNAKFVIVCFLLSSIFFGSDLVWAKALSLCLAVSLAKGVFARFRIDQLMDLNWKLVLPFAFAQLVIVWFYYKLF